MSIPFIVLTASTKRAQLTGGKRGAPTPYLTGLACTPLDPIDPGRHAEIQQRFNIETPHLLVETFLDGHPDIVASDRFVVDGKEYVVRGVARWGKAGSLDAYTHLTLEDEATT